MVQLDVVLPLRVRHRIQVPRATSGSLGVQKSFLNAVLRVIAKVPFATTMRGAVTPPRFSTLGAGDRL